MSGAPTGRSRHRTAPIRGSALRTRGMTTTTALRRCSASSPPSSGSPPPTWSPRCTDPASSPVLAVGSTVIDLTPTPLKEWAIAQFGTADKPILVGSVHRRRAGAGRASPGCWPGAASRYGAGLLVVAGRRRRRSPPLPARRAGPLDVLPALSPPRSPASPRCGGWSARRPRASRGAPAAADAPTSGVAPTRRGVLIAAGALAAAAVAMGGAGRWIGEPPPRRDRRRPARRRPTRRRRSRRPRGEVPRHHAVPDPQRRLLPGRHPARRCPIVDVDDWTLTIDGDVDQEVDADLRRPPRDAAVERDITLTCVSNERRRPVRRRRPLARRTAHRRARPGRHRRRRRPDPRAPTSTA